MIVLDTDHFGEFQKGTSSAARQLRDRLEGSGESVATTIVSIEEVMRGWLAAIHRQKQPRNQILSYQRLERFLNSCASWRVLSWDERAAARFDKFREDKIRIATMDLKIASIVLMADAILLSGNLRDFQQVPGLRVEDWLHTA